jgi:zinc protease
MRVPFEKRTLANGLDVIVHEDRRLPLVAVSVWYHVGSRNERPGKTGFAHLFEHLMFEGSEHQPLSFFAPLQDAGGTANGSTSFDRTDYWEVVPREAARRALWMEADRMGWMLPVLTQARFETQRGVVINERRQNYENRPYGMAPFAIARAIYPPDHPYAWPTIGETEDIEAATLDDVRDFFQRYYHPGNASLAIGGDVTAAEAFALAQELFAEIPAGPAVAPVTAPPVMARDARVVVEDRVDLPRLYLTWPTPAFFADGDAELDLAADFIATGRTSRLYRRLIHERRLATDISASQASRELGGLFQVVATAAPGVPLGDLHEAIVDELRTLIADGPTADEMERGRAQAEAAFIYRLQSLGGFGGRVDQLNAYNVYFGTPDVFDRDLGRYRAATAESVREAFQQWIDPDHASAVSFVPEGRPDLGLSPSVVVP